MKKPDSLFTLRADGPTQTYYQIFHPMKPSLSRILTFLLPSVALLSCRTTQQAPGERADAKSYDGIYYGPSVVKFVDYGNAKFKVPRKTVVFPDGKSVLTTIRFPSGTATAPASVTLIGNHASWKVKPSFRLGPMLAGTQEGVCDFFQNPARIVFRTTTVNGKPDTSPPEVAYKQGTREAAALERQWASSNTWHVPGEKFSRPVRNIDRGEIPQAGEGIAGTFIVISPRMLFGLMRLSHVSNTPGGREIFLYVLYPDVIPHSFQTGDKVVVSQNSPLISRKPDITLGGQLIQLDGIPFDPAEIKPAR